MQYAPIHLNGRLDPQEPENGGSDIDVSSGKIIHHSAAKIRPARDQGVVHIQRTERSMGPFVFGAVFANDHARRSPVIQVGHPAHRDDHVRRRIGCVDLHLVQRKGALDRSARENHAGKICSLQKFNQPLNGFLVMIDDVKGNASTEPNHHDIASLGILKFAASFEPVLFQNGRNISAALNSGKAMVRNDDEVGLLGELAIIQSLPDFIEVAVAIFDRRQRCIRAHAGFML